MKMPIGYWVFLEMRFTLEMGSDNGKANRLYILNKGKE